MEYRTVSPIKIPMHMITVPFSKCATFERVSLRPFETKTVYSLNEEIREWFICHNLDISDESQFMFRIMRDEIFFFFKDPKLATMFKLAWGNL